MKLAVAETGSRGKTEGRLNKTRTLLPGRDRDTCFAPTFVMRWTGEVYVFQAQRSSMPVVLRIPTMPGRSTSDFYPPGGHRVYQAQSAAKCSTVAVANGDTLKPRQFGIAVPGGVEDVGLGHEPYMRRTTVVQRFNGTFLSAVSIMLDIERRRWISR